MTEFKVRKKGVGGIQQPASLPPGVSQLFPCSGQGSNPPSYLDRFCQRCLLAECGNDVLGVKALLELFFFLSAPRLACPP